MIIKSTGIFIKDRSVLFLRKKDFYFWITPGGKIEDGETPEQALDREMMEELSTRVKITDNLGIFEGKTFNKSLDDLVPIKMYLFKVDLLDEIKLNNEIIDQAYIKYCDIQHFLMNPTGLRIIELLHSKDLID